MQIVDESCGLLNGCIKITFVFFLFQERSLFLNQDKGGYTIAENQTAREFGTWILISPQTIYRIHPRRSDRLVAHRQQRDHNRQQASDREHPPGNLRVVLKSAEPNLREVPRYRYSNKARDHD